MASDDHLVLFRRVPATLRRRPLQDFARALRDRVAHGRGFHCLITDDCELRRLNRQFRAADYATDVLSFPAEVGAGILASSPSPPTAPPSRRASSAIRAWTRSAS